MSISVRGTVLGSRDEARGKESKSMQYGHMKGISTDTRATGAPNVTDGVLRIMSEWKASQESLVPMRSRAGGWGWVVISWQLLLGAQGP